MTQARATTVTESVVGRATKFGDELIGVGKAVFHAGVGVIVATEEQARETFGRMVDRGKNYESDEGRLFSRAKREAREIGQQMEQGVEKAVAASLSRAGVPNRDEINQLINRVEALTHTVEELAAKQPAVKEE
jgi:polyhydroxyalkanoate synthesis regulator phasin